MRIQPRRPAWQSITLGVLIGVAIAAAVVGGIYGFVLIAHEGPVAPPTPAETSGASASAVAAAASGRAPSSGAASPAAVSAPSPAAASSGAAGPSSPHASSSGAAAPSASGPLAVVDPSILALLPAMVGGLPVKEYPDAEHQAVADPDLGRNVSRVATAFVGDAGGANWAYTAVVDVRPAARSEAFYRDWQESFDTSACERAGGVTGHTTMVIAGRDVERTACGAGVRTYHVRIAGSGLLVSISDLGDAKFGELEIAALRL